LSEFKRYKYSSSFATGTIAVGGTLGILIPPSVILVVYAITTEQNIAKLFKAALIPGLMAALFYCIAIALVVRRRPHLAPDVEVQVGNRWKAVAAVWPVLLIALMVVGGIYGGIFTPTEGAAFGAIAMLLVGLLQRSLSLQAIVGALKQTADTTGMIFIILLGSEVFNAFLARSQMPTLAAEWVTSQGLPPYVVMVCLLALYILLGAVMDELAMLLLTLPVFFPIVQALDFGLPADEVAIWFGILVLIVVGIGLTAPPIGLNVFVISSIARNVPIASTYRGVLPFIGMDIIRLGLVVAFPGLALWLVRLLS
jgi:tripartite ATP-independent transporter DctM subunit